MLSAIPDSAIIMNASIVRTAVDLPPRRSRITSLHPIPESPQPSVMAVFPLLAYSGIGGECESPEPRSR